MGMDRYADSAGRAREGLGWGGLQYDLPWGAGARSCCWTWGLWQWNPSCRAGHPGPSCKGTAGLGGTRRGMRGDPLAVLGVN